MEVNNQIDTALASLVTAVKMLGVNASLKELGYRLGKGEAADLDDLVYLAEDHLGLNAKKIDTPAAKLTALPTPFIVSLKGGKYGVVAQVGSEGVLYFDPEERANKKETPEAFAQNYDGKAVVIGHKGKTENERFGLSWFLKLFFENKKIMGQIIFAALIVQMIAMVTPLFTMIIIDKVFSSSGTSTLEVLIIALFIIGLFEFLIGYSRKHLLSYVSGKVDVIMVSKFFKHLITLPISFFQNRQSGDTVARFKEIEFIRNFIGSSVLTTLIDIPFSVIFMIVLFLFNPMLATIVLLAIALTFILYGVVGPVLKENFKKKHQQETESQSFIYEIISGIETIKSMSIEPKIQRQFEDILGKQSTHSQKTEGITGTISQVAGFINKMTVALCLWIGALYVLDGEMTAGQLIAFNMLIGRAMTPASKIAQMLQQIYQVKISTKRISEIFKSAPEPALYTKRANLPALNGSVSFQDVAFQYTPDTPFVLENIGFDVKAGEVIGIVGSSGSGKSTLMRLVQRLHTPTKGKILIDGIDIANIDPTWLRRRIGVVMQDNLLLNRSVKENIAMANPMLSMDAIEKAARLSGADEVIRKLPEVYDTVVGERGNILSTGERQRIALARAIVNDPKILILDEATSALDFESELHILDNLREICKDRTVFIVAHRLSTLKYTDRIIHLESGKIIEHGPIKTLAEGDGKFSEIARLQMI